MALLFVVSACADDGPPAGARASLDTLRDRIGALAGIASVEAGLGHEDGYGTSWKASVTATATTADLATAAEVAAAAEDGVTGASLDLTVDFPASEGLAPVGLDPRIPSLVELAEELRASVIVDSVRLDAVGNAATITSDASFVSAASEIRPLIGDAPIVLSRGHAAVTITPTVPGAAVLSVVDALAVQPTVSMVDVVQGGLSDRPLLRVTSTDAAAVAGALASTVDEAADAGTARRTEFASSQDGVVDVARGWVGLPLGSPEPDDEDAWLPPDNATATPVDVTEQEAAIRAFLEHAVTATGIPTEVTTQTRQCADEPGTQAVADALVPVFTVYDDARKSFGAVVSAWRAAGLQVSGRAMGRDYWSAGSDSPAGVSSASIRGTADGLSLDAESVCVT
jgi:hypothetical protein